MHHLQASATSAFLIIVEAAEVIPTIRLLFIMSVGLAPSVRGDLKKTKREAFILLLTDYFLDSRLPHEFLLNFPA